MRLLTRTSLLCWTLSSWTSAWKIGDDCPSTLVSHISYGHGWDGDLPAIYKALITCPNITSLDLSIEQGGCVMGGEPWNFHILAGDKMASLRDLRLSGYIFDDYIAFNVDRQRWEHGIWRWEYTARDILTGDEPSELVKVFPERIGPEPKWESYEGRHALQWLKAMDWSKLEALEITDPSLSFLTTMVNQTPALRTLKFIQNHDKQGSQYEDALFAFIQAAGDGKLENLSIVGHHTLALGAVSVPLSASPALRSLEISWWAAHSGFWNEPNKAGAGVTASHVRQLGAMLPHLERLSIGMSQEEHGASLSEILDALTTLQTVKFLDLDVPPSTQKCRPEWLKQEIAQGRSSRIILFCNVDAAGYPPKTSDRIAAAQELFAELRDRKSIGAEELQRLQIREGVGWWNFASATITCIANKKDGSRKPEDGEWCYDAARVLTNTTVRAKFRHAESDYYQGRWMPPGPFDAPLTIDAA